MPEDRSKDEKINSGGSDSSSKESTLYDWAFRAGKTMYECLSEKSSGSDESVRNQLRNFILSLRSELTPERFRRTLVNQIVSIMTECDKTLYMPKVLKEERPWTVNEFYRFSTAILAGLYEAIFSSSNSKNKE